MRDEGQTLMTTLAAVEHERRFRAKFWRIALGALGLFWIAVLLAIIN